MRIYFSDSQIPELMTFPKAYRYWVRKRALALLHREAPLLTWLPMILSALGGLAGAFAGSFSATALHGSGDITWSVFGSTAGVGIGGAVGGFLGAQWLTQKVRPYLRRVLKDDESTTTPAV